MATALNAAAVETAGERGFTEMRLFVAAGQARARRFYEREGWRAVGEPFFDPVPGLTLVEYRIGVRDPQLSALSTYTRRKRAQGDRGLARPRAADALGHGLRAVTGGAGER